MTDGYALIEINNKGEGRLNEVKFFDPRLEDLDFDEEDILHQVMNQLPNVPDMLVDVLVMVSFKYESRTHYYPLDGDYDHDGLFSLFAYNIVKDNYKEFYREMVTIVLDSTDGIESPSHGDCSNYYKELVANWEEFYNEEFKPFKKESKKIKTESLSDLSYLD